MGLVIAVANQKGGVGKTTTVINSGAQAWRRPKRVLLVDFDPQANCTSGMGLPKAGEGLSTYAVLSGVASAQEAARLTELPGLSILPGSISLAGAEVELVGMEREFVLKRAGADQRQL